MQAGVRFAVLGPVRAWRDQTELDLGPPQQRAVLAALLLREGAQATLDELTDGLWGDQPPATSTQSIRVYIYRLRQTLGSTGPGRITSAGGGYLLPPDPQLLDLTRFTGLLAQARRARDDGNPAAAAERYAESLALWTGTALADLPGPYAAAQRTRLDELRLTAREEHLATVIDLGHYHQAVAELPALITDHPLRERLRELHLHALYATGRQADALEVFRQAARQLRDELGIDPGPALRTMHQRILGNDPALLHPTPPPPATARPPAAPAPGTVPAQLPPDIAHFTGRDTHLQVLTALAAEAGNAVVITAIGGTAGIGKTALALHWAHQHAAQFPDGQVYVNLRGFDPAATPLPSETAIRGFLDALAVPPERIPASPDAQAALFRSQLAGKRMLIVLDNARDPDQVRPLLPGTPGTLALITSRNQLTGLAAADGAHTLTLDLLTPPEARDLLARRLGTQRITAEPDAAGELAELCARLPLALNITAARATARPAFPLSAFATQLRQARDRLDALDTGDATASVRAVFSWSYQALTPAAARTFRLLGLHPGPDITPAATASLTAAPRHQATAALNELAAACLLTEHAPGRYTCHDLLRAYAAELARTHDTDEQCQALQRMLDHYLHTGYAAEMLLNPARDPINPATPRPGTAPEELADDQQAWHWLEAEHPVILAAIAPAAARGFDRHACLLPWTVATYLYRRGKWHDSVAAHTVSLAAAQRLGDLAEQARIHRTLGNTCERLGSYVDADAHQHRALELYRQLGDHAGQGATHFNLTTPLQLQDRHREALDHARQALELYRTAGHQVGQAKALNAVGWFCSLLGDYQQALAHCQQALVLQRDLGDQEGEAATLDSLGHAHHHLGHHRRALQYYRQALDLFRKVGNRYEEAVTLTNFGDTHHAAGDHDAARDAWEQAQAIFEDLQHPDAEQVRHKLKTLS